MSDLIDTTGDQVIDTSQDQIIDSGTNQNAQPVADLTPPLRPVQVQKPVQPKTVGGATASFVNGVTGGLYPAALDAYDTAVNDPASIPQMAIEHASNPLDPTAGIKSTNNRDAFDAASQANPEANRAGMIAGVADVAPSAINAVKSIPAAIDNLILNKLGPKALQMANEFAESVILRGTKKSSQQIQQMRKSGMMDQIKKLFIDKINPGVLESNVETAGKLAEIGKQPIRNSSNPVLGASNTVMGNKPSSQTVTSAAKTLQETMAPGVNKAISEPIAANSLTAFGAAANVASKRSNLIGYKTSTAVAQKALQILESKTGQNVALGEAVLGRKDIIEKMRAISQMEPAAAASFSYAESLVNPAFRMAWMEAQNDSGTQQ